MSPSASSSVAEAKAARKKRKEEMLTIYKSEFQKLNEAQRRAVETIEGPVMVIAGPGTGKTQTVAMRVAHILQKTQMRPSNILCLTFSVSGATAMRDRLRLLIGPDAYGVTVSTIHGFCSDLIESHPVLFDEWSARDPISDIERFRSVNTTIDQLLPDLALLNPKHPYSRTRDILDRISQIKREGKTEKELRAIVDQYAEEMEQKSKPGTKVHEKNLLAARKFRELTEIFCRYQQMLEATHRFDYDDMLLYAIRALEREEWLLMSLQERYQYILVDEFQDTNGAQYRLLELLTTYPTVEQDPNIFVVGDDDQAIYRFQGANLTNMLSFHERFPNAPVIPLTVSYRATQAILDAASQVIAQNTERLVGRIKGLQKNLESASEEQGIEPCLLRAPSDMAEPWMIADLLEERIKSGVPPSEIAVLTQTNSELRGYYDVLRARKIPVQMTGKVDLLIHPLVSQIIAIIKAIQRPRETGALAAALACDTFDCHAADLGKLFALARESKVHLYDLLLKLDEPAYLPATRNFHALPELMKARDRLLDLHQKLETRTVVETVERILHDCGFLASSPIDPLDLAALQEFFDRVKHRAYEQPSFSFQAFVEDLSFYQNPDYGALRMSYELPHLVQEGVQLMTAHQSKGKEFEVVILANFRDGHWDKRRNPSSLSVPEDLLFGWQKEQKSFEQHQDERRVAFVAMTRAKRELIFSCPEEVTSGDKARSVSPSAFFAEAGALREESRSLKDPAQASTLLFANIRDIDAELRAYLLERLQNFSLSASAINRFLEDPQKFLEVDLLQVPQLSDYSHAYGNAIHWALRQWALAVQKGMPIGLSEMLGEFQRFLEEREFVTDGERDRLAHIGKEALPRYYDARLRGSSPVIHAVEVGLTTRIGDPSDRTRAGIPLKGRIDRIDLDHPDSARATIIDFKTGRPLTDGQIRGGADGHILSKDAGYYRQLLFYAVLLEGARPILEPKAFVLDFVGERAEHPVERVFQISEQEKTEMKKLIGEIWKKVTALDFSPL